ncbi:malto-oligosyltrehalose synthase [Pedococcus aerophilus]|uniref:Malto-oligosyltrehalose synthase n=1 Tax=Pedococcus aerophilus TaxID=436356 RepID=A0ABP6H916_9MICO
MQRGTPPHRPAEGRVVPTATYRLQVHGGFTFDNAAEQASYLDALGVSHAYLSPVLQPAPGSTHGYDVVNHDLVNEEAGGGTELARLSRTLSLYGLGVIVDVVPNHMTTPTPAHLNRQWWSLLRDGRSSEYAHWFDVDWAAEEDRVLLPVLGGPLSAALDAGELSIGHDGGHRGDETVLRYFDHEFPVRPGTDHLPVQELVEAQWYLLCDWREGTARLNYRRFFDVTTLAAVRVEDPEVFDATHRLLLYFYRSGFVDGFRIDHPDGLADPGGYLDMLADATGDAWVVAEKILEGHEELLDSWRCAGTTGYDTLLRVGGVFVDPAGKGPLTDLLSQVVGHPEHLDALVVEAKQQVVAEVQAAEVNRLMRLVEQVLPWHDQASLKRALGALLVAMDRYRAYVGGPDADPSQAGILNAAESRAMALVSGPDQLNVSVIAQLARGGRLPEAHVDTEAAQQEFVVRFQQTCGPVMAKGIEDTTFYRYARLTSLNEVGGDPELVGISPEELHEFSARQLATWPTTMTTLSTHDTKRSEDVRARLAVVSELSAEWKNWVEGARRLAKPHRGKKLDPATEYFLLQTAVGAWPISVDRLQAYATKAIREAKRHTTWTDQDEAYEADVQRYVAALLGQPALVNHCQAWVTRTAAASRSNILGQKLLQLVVPGIPDVYQGTEVVDLSLVDPDNRRPVDYGRRRTRLARLDKGEAPADLDDEKLLVTSRALRLRHHHAQWFTGPEATYLPVSTTSEYALAVGRGDQTGLQVVAVVTRLSDKLASRGGWGEAHLALPEGEWHDLFTGRAVVSHEGRPGIRLERLLADLPVALLVRHGTLGRDEIV